MKAVFIIAQKDFRDEELLDTKAVLETNGISVDVAAPEKSEALGKLGVIIQPDLAISEVREIQYQAIIFVGGQGAYNFFESPEIYQLIDSFNQSGKLIAAICSAPMILAKQGLLQNRQATVHSSGLAIFAENGVDFVDDNVVRDENIITANGPAAASTFGQEIVKYLTKNI